MQSNCLSKDWQQPEKKQKAENWDCMRIAVEKSWNLENSRNQAKTLEEEAGKVGLHVNS